MTDHSKFLTDYYSPMRVKHTVGIFTQICYHRKSKQFEHKLKILHKIEYAIKNSTVIWLGILSPTPVWVGGDGG